MKPSVAAPLLVIITLIFSAGYSNAGSQALFPKGWDKWPVSKMGKIPGAKTPIDASLPPIVQATFKTYNWVQDGKGSAYNVRFNPAQEKAIAEGKGNIADGPTAVLDLTDIKVILVTEHLMGEPQYGAFSYDGKDISGAHPSLDPKVCTSCHSGYGEACKHGVCSK